MREIKFRAWDNDMHEWTTAFDMDNDGVVYPAVTPYSNNPDIRIMEYTGLHDKNGKEIYEGDIVREVLWRQEQTDDVLGKVHWSDGNAGFWVSGRSVLTEGYTQDLEVIGNIYENPELLERPNPNAK
jgi:uncharacterized phage protein (TIGR01671 family)